MKRAYPRKIHWRLNSPGVTARRGGGGEGGLSVKIIENSRKRHFGENVRKTKERAYRKFLLSRSKFAVCIGLVWRRERERESEGVKEMLVLD